MSAFYVFYTGVSDNHIKVTQNTSGAWSAEADVPIGGTYVTVKIDVSGTPTAQSAIIYGSYLYLFYVNSSGELRYCTFVGGTTWTQSSTVLSTGIVGSPSAVTDGTNIYVFYEGPSNSLQFRMFNGSTWGSETTITNSIISGGISMSPSAIYEGTNPFCFYQSNDFTGGVQYTQYMNSAWTQHLVNMNYSNYAPSVVYFQSKYYLFHMTNPTGSPYSGKLYYNESVDGIYWGDCSEVPDTLFKGVVSTALKTVDLHVFYRGSDDKLKYNWTHNAPSRTSDGWQGVTQIRTMSINSSPTVVYTSIR